MFWQLIQSAAHWLSEKIAKSWRWLGRKLGLVNVAPPPPAAPIIPAVAVNEALENTPSTLPETKNIQPKSKALLVSFPVTRSALVETKVEIKQEMPSENLTAQTSSTDFIKQLTSLRNEVENYLRHRAILAPDDELIEMLKNKDIKAYLLSQCLIKDYMINIFIMQRKTNKILEYLLITDKDYSSSITFEEFASYSVAEPHHRLILKKFALNNIQSAEQLSSLASCFYPSIAPALATKFLLDEYPELAYLDPHNKPLPTLSNPHWLFYTVFEKINFKKPFRCEHITISKSPNQALDLYCSAFNYRYADFNNYLTGLRQLAARNKISFDNGTQGAHNASYNNKYVESQLIASADIGTLTGCQGNGYHIILKTPQGKMTGIQLAMQTKWITVRQGGSIYRTLADELQPIEFAQATIMIACYRTLRTSPNKHAILYLLPHISEYIDGKPRNKIDLDFERFQSTAVFKILTNTTILSQNTLKKRSQKIQAYITNLGLFKSYKPLAKDILETVNRLEVKTESLISYIVQNKMQTAASQAKKTQINEPQFIAAITSLVPTLEFKRGPA